MLAHRKYDRRVASSCWPIALTAALAGRRRLFEAEQEVGRHQQRLERDRDALVERLAACPRLTEERRVAGRFRAGTGRRNARVASDPTMRLAHPATWLPRG